MSDVIPTFTGLEDVYGPDAPVERIRTITSAFTETYGAPPELLSRAPGRVNLIGEHIDYEGYAVLPMAIRQDTVVAIKKAGTKLVISNVNKSKYPTTEFTVDPKQEVDVANHSWANYFMAAYKGVFEYLATKGLNMEPTGLQVMIEGQVPTGSGLSSSSALVCSCCLAILGAFNVEVPKADIAEFSCRCERYVGVTSGGMDQAISMMAMPGLAKLIEFNPVRASDVHLPPGATFVIANSLAVSNKAETAPFRYNMRVVECRLASGLLARALGKSAAEALALTTLKELEPLIEAAMGPGSFSKAVEAHLHEERYSQEEVEGLLGTRLEEMYKDSPASLKVLGAARQVGGFALRQRALHVYGEAARVHAFKSACEGPAVPQHKMVELGALMNDSHTSCSQLYECSCPELEELVGIARDAGALGARLTGAGWGGATVSLVREDEAEGFIATLKRKYYSKRVEAGVVTAEGLPECVFASKPSAGGALLRLGAAALAGVQ